MQAVAGTPLSITPIPPAGAAVSDVNGNETVRLTDVACWTQPDPQTSGGSVVRVSDTELLYTPAQGFTGPDTFSYCVTDNPLSLDASDPANVVGQVTVDVVAAGAPGVVDDNAQVEIGATVDIDVLDNDPIGDSE